MTMSFAGPVELWPLDRLIPHARNARTHSDTQVAQIAGSIAVFVFVNPAIVGDGGMNATGGGGGGGPSQKGIVRFGLGERPFLCGYGDVKTIKKHLDHKGQGET
jgi:hypothetical protein